MHRRFLMILIAIALVGCTPAKPATPPTPVPPVPVVRTLTEVARIELPANSRFSTDTPLSPDGKWVSMFSQLPDNGFQITIYPAEGGAGRKIADIPGSAVKNGTLQLTDIGWTKNGRFIYSREGTQPDGPHKGTRGFSLMTVTLGKDSVTTAEAVFIPVPAGSYVTLTEMPGHDTVLTMVGQVLWSVNFEGATPVVKQRKLPGPEAAYYPALSPSGQEIAYFSGVKLPGVHILNLLTGVDTNAIPQGETMSYYPKWSPDGKYLAVYTAVKLSGSGANAKYDYIPGEDGPYPVGNRIDIVTIDGKKMTSVQVQGLKVADFRWAGDSQHVLFASVKQKGTATVEWQALYAADLAGKTTKLGDVPAGIMGGEIIGESAGAKSAYAITYAGGQADTTLYSFKEGQPAAKLAMPAGGKFWLGYSYESLGDTGIIMYEADRLRGIVQLPSLTAVTKEGQAYLGNTAAKRFVYTYEQHGKKPQLVVMSWN